MCVLFLFLSKFTLLDLFTTFITAHVKASFASGVWAAIRLSVTLRYYVKMRGHRRMQSLPSSSPVPPVF